MQKPKNRTITFRLSEEEFSAVRQICAGDDFLSFSDLVRTAVQELISNRSARGPIAIQNAVERLSTRMENMEQNLKLLIYNGAPSR